MVISQLWNVIFRHAIHHNAGNVLYTFNSIMWRYALLEQRIMQEKQKESF